MGLFNTIRMGSSGVVDAYEIDRSIRLNRNDSSYFEIARSSDGNRKKWTFSTWLKVANHGNDLRGIFAFNGTGNNRENFTFEADGKMAYQLRVGGSNKASVTTTAKFRDPTAWYHIVFIWDSDNGTSADRAIIYVNGTRQDVTTYITPASGAETYINSTTTHYINNDAHWGAGDYSYAETYFIDGQAYDPTYFAETNAATGQWNPKEYTSGFSGNSFYCNYSDNSGNTSTTIGKDSSGLGNNITPFNVSVSAGSGNDSLEDTPTNNWCTLNPLFNDNSRNEPNFSNGNLDINNNGGGDLLTHGTFAVKSGKYYFEAVAGSVSSGGTHFIGVQQEQIDHVLEGVYRSDGRVYNRLGSASDYGVSYSSGDVIGVAFDADTGKVWFAKNNTYLSSGDPAAGTNDTLTYQTTNHLAPALAFDNTSDGKTWVVNFGQRPFTYTPPTNFKALNSNNLSDPTILLPNKHFDTLLYTGNASARNITGLEFDPDFVWVKNRSAGYDGELYDTVRGDNKRLFFADQPLAEATNGKLSFGVTGGFALTSGGGSINGSSENQIAWNWNGGTSTVTNNNGSISSQVRTNSTAGYSILTYTGTGSAGATVGHGLGVTPDVIIIKNRTDSTGAFWAVYHHKAFESASDPNIIYFNSDQAEADDTNVLGTSVTINSTVFSLGDYNGTNGSGDNMVSYCFSEVEGYSKFGTYTGNGNSDGTFVYTGFRPAFIIIKNVGSTTEWRVYADDLTNGFNPVDKIFYTNLNNAETTTGHPIDFVSNGVKMRGTFGEMNSSGDEFVYICFAESPFKYSRAS